MCESLRPGGVWFVRASAAVLVIYTLLNAIFLVMEGLTNDDGETRVLLFIFLVVTLSLGASSIRKAAVDVERSEAQEALAKHMGQSSA